jgi:hypothetical protein
MNDIWYSPADAAAVIEEYCRANGWGEGHFCGRFRLELPYGKRRGWVTRMKDGDVRVSDIARVVEACAATWPSSATWPPYVARPRGRMDHDQVRKKESQG